MINLKIAPPIRALVAELEGMKEGMGEKGIRAGLVRGVAPLKSSMKSLAPRHLGHMIQAIGHTSISKRAKARLGVPQGTAAILVGANRKIAITSKKGTTKKYWQGQKAHWNETGTQYMRARPFMGPALSASGGEIESRFYDGLTAYLEKQRARRPT